MWLAAVYAKGAVAWRPAVSQAGAGCLHKGLGVNAAHFTRLQNAGASDDRCGCAQGNFVLVGRLGNGGVGIAHDACEALVDFFFAPVEAGEVLHPLEVRNGNAACVGQHIRYDQNAFVAQNVVALRGGGTVCAFDYDFGADAGCVFSGDLAFKGGRYQEFALQRPEFGCAQCLCTSKALSPPACAE